MEEDSNVGAIDLGLVEELTLLTYLSEVDESTFTGDAELLHKLNGAKQKLNSIDEIVTVVKSVDRALDQKSAATKRGWVHKLKNLHPKVQEVIKDLKYFKEVSDEVGSRIIGYTIDTPSLDLEDWRSEKPQAIRENVKYKIKNESEITDAYHKLNTKMYNNISNEFITERERFVELGMLNFGFGPQIGHDFHIAGDVSYVEKISGTVSTVLDALISQLSGVEDLINTITPVNNLRLAEPGDFNVSVENGPEITINYKGDRVVKLPSKIDNSKIEPIDE